MEKSSTIIGLVLAFALILFGIGDPKNIANFIDPGSILIVFGGTIGTVLMVYGISGLKASIQLIKVAMTRNDADRVNDLVKVYNLSTKARKKNLLALEEDCAALEDEFLKTGLQMAIDGISGDTIKTVLTKEIESTVERHSISHDILNYIGEVTSS